MKRLIRGVLSTLAVAGVCSVTTPAQAANMLTNPGFETGAGTYTGWTTFGSGVQLSTPATDNIFRSGAAASKIFGGFNGCPLAPTFNVGGYLQSFSPTVGNTYEFSGFAYIASTDPISGTNTCVNNRVIAKLAFFNAVSGGAEIASSEIVIGDGNTALNAWKGFTFSAPAPSGALRVEALILFLQPGCATGSVFVDDLSLENYPTFSEPNALTNPRFSSGLTGWTSFGNVFVDTRAFAVRSPGGSAKLFSTFVTGSSSGMFQSQVAAPGSSWTFKVHGLSTCVESPINGLNDNFVLAHIAFKDAGNIEISGADAIVRDASSGLGTWTEATAVGVAPPGTVAAQAFILFVSPTNKGGAAWVDDIVFRPTLALDVAPKAGLELALSAPAPNPSRGGRTNIGFALPQDGELSIRVYDIAGRGVATLLQGTRTAGNGSVQWDGRRSDGSLVRPGIYQIVLRSAGRSVTRNLVLMN